MTQLPLHNCTVRDPSRRFLTEPSTWLRDREGKRLRTIDLHCHALSREVEARVAACPQKQAEAETRVRTMGQASVEYNAKVMMPESMPALTDIAVRLRDMDSMGVDMQVISPSPSQYYYWAEYDLAREIVALQNEGIAQLCAQYPERLIGLGTLALQHPKLAVEQLEHAVRQLGLRGFEVSTSISGLELADESLEPVWARAEALGCVVFIHPMGTSLGERLRPHYLSNIVGQPVETAIALSHLIFGGVLDRYPQLKLCAAHGGGYLPTYMGRSEHGYAARVDARTMDHAPSHYLRRIFFDSLVYSPQALRMLIDQVGVSQVVLGTDYPFDMGHYDVHALIGSTPGLDDEARAAILAGNAARLLELPPLQG
jgi:aminocarboxymuconate-semialdehyde decarboxylase